MKHSDHGPAGPRDAGSVLSNDLSALDAARPGDLIVNRAWKFNGQAHYVVPGDYLGADEHGHWVIQRPGCFVSRPGIAFFAKSAALLLIPRDEPWLATFHPRTGEHAPNWFTYVDVSAMIRAVEIAGPAVGGQGGRSVFEVDSFDMDLDAVNSRSRGPFVDDEDEFAEHSALFGYPQEVVAAMRDAADRLMGLMRAHVPPFDDPSGVVDSWWETARTLTFPNPTMETP